MSDHEFEKQVRQKLDDLRLTPTPSAWERVQQGLRVSRRRRAPLIWLPVLLIGLGAGGYFAFKQTAPVNDKESPVILGKKETVNETAQPSEESREKLNNGQKTANNQLETTTNESELTNETRDEKKPTTATPGTPGAPINLNDARSATSPSQKETRPFQLTTADPRETQEKKKFAERQENLRASQENLRVTQEESYHRQHALQERGQPASREIRQLTHYNGQLQPDLGHYTRPVIQELPAPAYENPSSTNRVAGIPIRYKRWSYGVTAFVGTSGINNGEFLGLDKALADNMQTPPAFAFAPSYTPYQIVSGLSYSAGVTVKRELSRRFQVSAGLNYLVMSTKFKLGNQVYGPQPLNAAPVGQYVRNYFTLERHQPEDYKNTFHFIEIPITLHTRLTGAQVLPVYWNTGLSYSRLVNSNSKQFDGSAGVYYSNEKQLNRSQLGVTTGVDVVLFGKRKYPLWVGPVAKFNFTRFGNESFPEKKNWLSAGLNMRVFLK